MQRRPLLIAAAGAVGLSGLPARAHHGWSSFDQNRPLWLSGKARAVAWRNPHAEFDLEVDGVLKLPPDLTRRALPAQSAAVDGPALLAGARLPVRRDRVWHIELAPLSRLAAWKVPELQVGQAVAVLGFSFADEMGEALLRAEYLFVGEQVYGMRSSPV